MPKLPNDAMQEIVQDIKGTEEEMIAMWKELAEFIFTEELEESALTGKVMEDLYAFTKFFEGESKDRFLAGVFGSGMGYQVVKTLLAGYDKRLIKGSRHYFVEDPDEIKGEEGVEEVAISSPC